MKVKTIAHTEITGFPDDLYNTPFLQRYSADDHEAVTDMDLLGEFAGRSCYQSWNTPNPLTAENEGYLNNILNQGHYSVLEHASVTFYVEGVSRSLTHELVRHRHLSYSELSQRYVDVSEALMVLPPAIRQYALDHGVREDDVERGFDEEPLFKNMREAYDGIVAALTESGVTRKRAREAARCIMPNAVETKIVVTGNLRAWRDFLGKRWHVAADAEIRALAGEILGRLREIAPNSVQDIPEQPYGSEQ